MKYYIIIDQPVSPPDDVSSISLVESELQPHEVADKIFESIQDLNAKRLDERSWEFEFPVNDETYTLRSEIIELPSKPKHVSPIPLEIFLS